MRKLVSTVEGSEGYWKQRLFKPENRKTKRTLAGVAVSVRRRWLKGKARIRQPVAIG